MPEKLPVLGKSMEELKDLNYQDTAYEVYEVFPYRFYRRRVKELY